MPFTNETASYRPLRRILQSEKVRRLQRRFRLAPAFDEGSHLAPSSVERPNGNGNQPELVLAVDGGYFAAEVDNGYPGAEIGYITIAAVLILLSKLHQMAKADIIDPRRHRETQKRSSIDTALPGRGVVIKGEVTPLASMRRVLYEEMAEYRVFPDSETLLDTYEALMEAAGPSNRSQCPCEQAMTYSRQRGEYACDTCGEALYSSDAMRLHELFSSHESCKKLYGHVMNTLERLWLIHALRAFERRGRDWLALIGKMGFFIDGPLAMYGTPAWLSSPICTELARLNQKQKAVTGLDMMIIGIEKSGSFTNHFEMLDANNDTTIKPGCVVCLDNEYIRKHIVPSPGERLYGRNTYFGRKVLYKTKYGHRLVVNLACFDAQQRDLSTANVRQFPRLFDALHLLDTVSSNLYPNSISPLIAAHSEAAIPLNLGRQILEDIAKAAVGR